MGALDADKVYRITADLIQDPTDLGTSSPYGGTVLGIIDRVFWTSGFDQREIFAEELDQVVELVEVYGNMVVGADLRQWDDDVITTIFPNVTGTAGNKVIGQSGAKLTGSRGTGRAFKLLLAAQRPTEHPSILVYEAVPLLAATERANLSNRREHVLTVIFTSIRNSSGKDYEIATLDDLTL